MSGIGGVDGGRGELVLGGPIGVGDGPSTFGMPPIDGALLGLPCAGRGEYALGTGGVKPGPWFGPTPGPGLPGGWFCNATWCIKLAIFW